MAPVISLRLSFDGVFVCLGSAVLPLLSRRHRYELLAKARDGRPSQLDGYKEYLHEQWNQGCASVRRLHAEIRERGYPGSYSTVWDYCSASGNAHPAQGPRHHPLAPEPARVPLLPVEDQRAYGESFRRLWDFARTLRTAYDEGTALIRDFIDATASLLPSGAPRPSSRGRNG